MAERETEGSPAELLAVAKLGAPRGLGGFLKVMSYSGEYGHLVGLKKVLGAFEDAPEKKTLLSIREVQKGDWGASFAFDGYDSPETARALTGMILFLPRSEACPLRKGEYYIRDLVGLSVMLGGTKVGKVVGVLEGGADPLLEVLADGRGASSLVPFRSAFVGDVDIESGSLELLAGWFLE
jgi:16S rRNA processing protein RimM